MTAASHTPAKDLYHLHRVPMSRPFTWLSQGWDDLLHHRGASLAYGWLVSSLGALILAYDHHPYFVAAAVSGFLLIGPVLTAGLCELSKQSSHGETSDFQSSLHVLHSKRHDLFQFANRLFFIGAVWVALCSMILYNISGSIAPTLVSTVWGDVMVQLSSTQIITYFVTGGILAVLVFGLSVVTVPMILDGADASSAMRTSIRVIWQDLPAILVWGAIIVVMVGIGFATFLVGMVVIFPLLGHATWYAYKELVQ